MNKKLFEMLGTIDLGRKLKVGAKDGSGFFFCGECRMLVENAEKYDIILQAAAKRTEINARKCLTHAVQNPPSLTDYIQAELYREIPKPSFDSFVREASAWMAACVKRNEAYKFAKDRFDNYAHLMTREVCESYDSDPAVDPDTTIIIVEGFEGGKYWTSDEAIGEHFGLRSEAEEVDE